MKREFVFLVVLMMLSSLAAQTQSGQWSIHFDYGLQAHDKRLFNFPWKERVLERQPETFGTHQFGLYLGRKVMEKGKIRLRAGVGLSTELATFERPFDYTYKKDDITKVLKWTDRYYQFMLNFPLIGEYKVSKHFGFSLGVLPQFNFFTIADHTAGNINYSWWRLNLYSIELNPGIEYTASKLVFGLRYRALQVKAIDRILFNSILKDPRTDQAFETYNPFKMWLSVGYFLDQNH